MRGVGDALERLSDGSAAGCDAGQRAGGDHLQASDVAQRGGLHRPADYITSAGVGCHLAEILIQAAAADYAEGANVAPGEGVQAWHVSRSERLRPSKQQRAKSPTDSGTGWAVDWQ